jgi:hypothetical protein
VDCEGIDAFDQTADYSTQIFALGLLMSGLLIYNQVGPTGGRLPDCVGWGGGWGGPDRGRLTGLTRHAEHDNAREHSGRLVRRPRATLKPPRQDGVCER